MQTVPAPAGNRPATGVSRIQRLLLVYLGFAALGLAFGLLRFFSSRELWDIFQILGLAMVAAIVVDGLFIRGFLRRVGDWFVYTPVAPYAWGVTAFFAFNILTNLFPFVRNNPNFLVSILLATVVWLLIDRTVVEDRVLAEMARRAAQTAVEELHQQGHTTFPGHGDRP